MESLARDKADVSLYKYEGNVFLVKQKKRKEKLFAEKTTFSFFFLLFRRQFAEKTRLRPDFLLFHLLFAEKSRFNLIFLFC